MRIPHPRLRLSRVPILDTHSISAFRDNYFNPGHPVLLPRGQSKSTIPAISKWFEHPSSGSPTRNSPARLNTTYLTLHASTLVPLELTRTASSDDGPSTTDTTTFDRFTAPLSLFLSWTQQALKSPTSSPPPTRLYLAQAPLTSLPPALQSDLPVPPLVQSAGKGDIYASSLWLGVPPTTTPLHRDPNPNLFVQLTGRKVVRLFRPEVGEAMFARVAGGGRGRIRGMEMMRGEEGRGLERAVWGRDSNDDKGEAEVGGAEVEGEVEEGFEAVVESGDGLFIPLGWWHSVKGVGEGITGSVNWWFR